MSTKVNVFLDGIIYYVLIIAPMKCAVHIITFQSYDTIYSIYMESSNLEISTVTFEHAKSRCTLAIYKITMHTSNLYKNYILIILLICMH